MDVKGRSMPSLWYEPVYHAARSCQGKRSGLTASRLRGLKWACQNESKKTAGFLAPQTKTQRDQRRLGSWACMLLLCLLKHGCLIAGFTHPHAIDNTRPDIGQGSDSHTVGFALRAFPLVIGECPAFLQRRLPGELVQGVAQWLQAHKCFACFGVIATLERHRSSPGQGLDAVGIGVTWPVIPPFSQQTWSQAQASTGKRTSYLLVRMSQKKGADLLIVDGNILDHHQQLLDQGEHQTLFGTDDDRARFQLGTMQFRDDLRGCPSRVGMLPCSQDSDDLFYRGRLSCLGRRVGLQKHEGGALLQLGKQVQGGRIVLLEASRQLVHQARLGLDQGILIAGERFQLLHGGAIRLQAAQLSQVKVAYFGQQMRVNLIGLGSCRFTQLIGAFRVDGIRDASFQQERDQQSMVRFDNARQVLRRSRNAQHKLFQFVQTFVAVGKAPRSDALARFIQHIHVMMGVRPIQSDVSHPRTSFLEKPPGGIGSIYNGCSKHVPPIIDWTRKAARGRTIFSYRSSRVEEEVFPWQCVASRDQPC